jgi:drug/metabolite transporter (DMT)-like permease
MQQNKHRYGFAAIGLMIASQVGFGLNDVWLRRIADDIGILETVWARSVLFLVIMAVVMRRADWKDALTTAKPHLQIARGLFPIIGAVLMIAAMGRIPVADAVATFFMAPLFACLLAMPLLGEQVGAERWLALALGIAGMLVIVRPGTGTFEWGHVFALLCAVSVAFYQIFTAFVVRHANTKTTLFFMAATAAVVMSGFMPFVWKTPSGETWLNLAGSSAFYAAIHGMYIMAHGRAEASRLAPFIYTQVLGTIAAGWFFYAQIPQPYTALGAALIALGGCMVLLRRQSAAATTRTVPASAGKDRGAS